MSPSAPGVRAAGAVLWRPAGDGPEVALIHRPRYDDWSLPKGKLTPAESAPVAAARELLEETGISGQLGRYLGHVEYALAPDQRKRADYWAAAALEGEFTANAEADQLRWLPVAAAARAVSYRTDRAMLRAFAAQPVPSHTLIVVRHAKAGRPERYRGEDRLRPLEARGQEQAAALVPNLLAFGARLVFAADRVRCVQTVAPLARELGTGVVIEPAFGEHAYATAPQAALARIRELERQTAVAGTVAVICSQGKVIPGLIASIALRDGVRLAPARNRKASMWILSFVDGKLRAADYLDSPLAPEVR